MHAAIGELRGWCGSPGRCRNQVFGHAGNLVVEMVIERGSRALGFMIVREYGGIIVIEGRR